MGMGTTIIGNPSRFAIEYELESAWPPSGRLTLWFDDLWFGDIRRSNFLYHMATSLQGMVSRDPSVVKCLYSDPSVVPGDDELLAGVGTAWGDSFDDFHFVLFAVESERNVHFLWELHQSREVDFPNYPLGPHHARVAYTVSMRS